MEDDFEKKCRIVKNVELGRYVVAACPIKAGETILIESPVVISPQASDRRCANCHKLTKRYCSKCRLLPLCVACSEHPECQQLADCVVKNVELLQEHPEIQLAIKCLIMRQSRSRQYATMLTLEAHLSERHETEAWTNCKKQVIDPMRESGLLEALMVDVDEELLQRLYSIIDVNVFEIRAPELGGSMLACYTRGAIFAHSCLPNVVTAIDGDYRLKMYANRYIAEGEIIFTCYTNILLGTDERRRALQTSKYFICNCARCLDPTELGTHMSTFLCTTCLGLQREGGYIVKQPTTGVWQCLIDSGHILKADYVLTVLERAKEEIFHAREDVYRQEILLSKLSRIFHGNHYMLIDLKQQIAAILRQILQNMSLHPSSKVYERKISLCQELLLVLKLVEPGISRLKAIALYELANTQAELGRKLYSEGNYTADELLIQLKQTEIMLRESLLMLLFEPLETPEGVLARSLIKELKDLQNDIKTLKQEPGYNKT